MKRFILLLFALSVAISGWSQKLFMNTRNVTTPAGLTYLENNAHAYYNFKHLTGADGAAISNGNAGLNDFSASNYDLTVLNSPTVRRIQAIPSFRDLNGMGGDMGTNGNTFLRSSFEVFGYYSTEDGQPATGSAFLLGHLTPSNPGFYISLCTDPPNAGKIVVVYGNPTDGFVMYQTNSAVWSDGFNGTALVRVAFDFGADTITIYKNGVVQAGSYITSGGGLSGLAGINPANYSGPNNIYVNTINNNGSTHSNPALGSLFDLAITPLMTTQQALDVTNYFLNAYFNLGLGQSNDEGQAEAARLVLLTTFTNRTPPLCFIYPKTTRTSADDGSWQALNVGTNTKGPEAGAQDTFADETVLAQLIAAKIKQPVHWIKTSRGGSGLDASFATPNWAVSSSTLFLQATQYYWTVAKTKYLTAFPAAHIKVILHWHQGETDTTTPTGRTNYGANLVTEFTALRAYDPLFATAPLYITGLNFFRDANEATINAANLSYVGSHANTYYIDISDTERKMDLTIGQKGGLSPTTSGGDDNHNAYTGQFEKAQRKYSHSLMVLNFFNQ